MDLDGPFGQSSVPVNPAAHAENRLLESRLIESIRLAQETPTLEDSDGSNGLQVLSMATLSPRIVADKNNIYLQSTPQRSNSRRGDKRGDKSPEQEIDSSSAKMKLRHELAVGLLAAGVNVNHYDKQGNTPLMAFAAELPEDDDYKTGPDILSLLINKGANVHARNRCGETALHIAVRRGRKLAARTLFKNGANVHARDAEGRSVLEVADVKIKGNKTGDPRTYAHYEACRAWLSGNGAVQEPSVLQEWGL